MDSSKQTPLPTLGATAVGGNFQSIKAAKQGAARLLRLFPLSNSMIIGTSADQTYLPMVEVKNQLEETVVVPLDFSLPLSVPEQEGIGLVIGQAAPGGNLMYCREAVLAEIASDHHSILAKAGTPKQNSKDNAEN